jgi:opacity protein-like surface antigen
MASLKTFAVAAAALAVLASSNVRAADLPALLPPPIEEYGGWYLRGDIGMSNQRVKQIFHPQMDAPEVFQWLDEGGFDSAPFFGIGLGYAHNSWFRWDATVEYRGKASFSALDRYETVDDADPATFDGTNDYTAKKSEWLLMWNAYLDLGTWKGITPFVGAGIGASRNTISHFRDVDVTNDAIAFAPTGSKWEFAWALHAGLAYDVTPNFTIELAYRYLDLGDGRTGILRTFAGACTLCQPVQFKGITSHDIKFGVRWMLADIGVSHWQPPIGTKY